MKRNCNSVSKLFGREILIIEMLGKRCGNERWGSIDVYYNFLLFWKIM
jgi:hypothetical protein